MRYQPDTYELLKHRQKRSDRRWAIGVSIAVFAVLACAALSAWLIYSAGRLQL